MDACPNDFDDTVPWFDQSFFGDWHLHHVFDGSQLFAQPCRFCNRLVLPLGGKGNVWFLFDLVVGGLD